MMIEAPRPQLIPEETENVQSAFFRFKKSVQFHSYSKSTQVMYATGLGSLQNYCEETQVLGVNTLTESDEIVENWTETLKRDGLSDDVIRTRISSLSSFRRWYENDRSVKVDLENGIILTKEQVDSLISSLKNLRDASLVLIPLRTGATLSETLNLEKDDIHSEDDDFMILFNLEKNDRFRQVPIDPITFALLTQYKDTLPESQQSLFITAARRTSEAEAEEILKEYGREIGIDGLNFTSLRNTFIHNFKGSIYELKERLGVH